MIPPILALVLVASASAASAATDPGNPYNSAVRRANPNSMQGTQPVTPTSPGLRQQVNPRPPTLQNGGIGNGNNLRTPPAKPDFDSQRPARSVDSQ
ncbi:hypothetical protein PMM47T1_13390 [Pseudomonas sp. M47T1]|nr:hypothetical protein PMM47T1_13390 [Pseudomonas sp. M47T1]